MNEMTDNPDYRLVMDFLQSINPGDMGEESAEQLMQIGQRIEGGGQLSDQEREMFMSVVGAMPMNPGLTNNFGSMSEAERELAMDQALPTNLSEEERRRFMEQKYFAQKRLEGEAAGMVEVPQMQSPRPRMRPEGLGMQSPRPPMRGSVGMSPSPRMRPDNLGG